jgi:hypothetical protein
VSDPSSEAAAARPGASSPDIAPSGAAWWAALGVVVLMFGWLAAVFVFRDGVPDRYALPAGVAVDVGQGVSFTPPGGWSRPGVDGGAVTRGVRIQKAGTFLFFQAGQFGGSASELLRSEVQSLGSQFQTFWPLDSTLVSVAGDLPALRSGFSGVAGGAQFEGEVIALTSAGLGVTVSVVSPAGQLVGVRGDVLLMLSTLQVPR